MRGGEQLGGGEGVQEVVPRVIFHRQGDVWAPGPIVQDQGADVEVARLPIGGSAEQAAQRQDVAHLEPGGVGAVVGLHLPSLEEVHTTAIPTHKWPPKASRNEFTRELAALWDSLAANMHDMQLWVKLLIFARVILPATSPRSSVGDQVKTRLRRWRAGEAAQLWQEALQSIEPRPRRGRKKRRDDEELTEEEKLKKRNAKRAGRGRWPARASFIEHCRL